MSGDRAARRLDTSQKLIVEPRRIVELRIGQIGGETVEFGMGKRFQPYDVLAVPRRAVEGTSKLAFKLTLKNSDTSLDLHPGDPVALQLRRLVAHHAPGPTVHVPESEYPKRAETDQRQYPKILSFLYAMTAYFLLQSLPILLGSELRGKSSRWHHGAAHNRQRPFRPPPRNDTYVEPA